MAVNTVTTPVIEASRLKTFSASTTVANDALTHWYNDSDPANSLVFAAAEGVVSIWRVDLRNPGTSDTVSTRVGFFRQTLDTAIGDLFFHYDAATTTGYLYVTGNNGNVWVYAFNPTTATSGEAVIQVSTETPSVNLNSGSTSLRLSNGTNNFVNRTLVSGTQFKIPGHNQTYSLTSNSTSTAVSATISNFNQPFDASYVPAPVDKLYVASLSNTISIVNPSNNSVTHNAITGFSQPFGITYVPAPVNKLYVMNFSGNTISIVNPSNNSVTHNAITGFSQPHGAAYVPAVNKLYVTNFGNGTISIVDLSNNNSVTHNAITGFSQPRRVTYLANKLYVTNTGNGTISIVDLNNDNSVTHNAITGFNSPTGLTYVPAPVDKLYVTNIFNGTISIVNPSNNSVTHNAITGFSQPYGVTYVPAPVDKLYVMNYGNNTISIVNPNTNQSFSGTFLSINFDPELEFSVAFNTPLIFNGPSFYTARVRIPSAATTTQPTLAINPAAGIVAVKNAASIFIYRNITPTSFDGINNVTVAGTSIPPFATGESNVGYYNITSNPITVTATTSQISLYYRANTFSYLLATNNTHQFFLYLINVDTATGTITTAKATFSTNALSASSLPRFASVVSLGSDNVALFVAGNALDLLYRFSETLFDGTSTITLNGVSIPHSSGYAVPATAALITFPHGSTVGQSRAAAIAFNPTTNRTLLFSGSGFNYDLPLTNFDGTSAITLKISVSPTSNQYSLASTLSNFSIPTFTANRGLDLDLADPSRSVLSALQGTFYLASLNRHTAILSLLNQRFTSTPAITKSSPTAPLTLSTTIDAYQAINLLTTGAQLISLQGSGGTSAYSNGEYYPFAFTQTDDSAGTIGEDFTLSGISASITGNYRLTMASGTTLTLSGKSSPEKYDDSFTLLSGATLAIAQNTTLTDNLKLLPGTTVTRAAGAGGNYILTLPYSSGGITAGAGITIQGLAATLAVTSLPTGANVAVYNAAGTLLLSGIADSSGIVSVTYTGGTTTITIRARLAGRIPFEATATLTSAGLTIPVFMPLDTNYTP